MTDIPDKSVHEPNTSEIPAPAGDD